jgi:signal transduction histidine kinase
LKGLEPGRKVDFVISAVEKVDGDPRLLKIVLENLLRNSWKYTSTHPRARIEFGSTLENGRTVYFVRDDGAGFDPRSADRLFQPFQRLHPTAEFPGNGIGLATVQRIVRRHGGEIWATGEVERGATFYFTLGSPRSRVPASEIRKPVAKSVN